MATLVLYIDKDFVIGSVVTNDRVFVVNNNDDEQLWLYFYNDPASLTQKPTYGKSCKQLYEAKTNNYIGLYDAINSKQTFIINGVKKEALDLLDKSNYLNNIKKKFKDIDLNNHSSIPTRVVFSPSINEFTIIEIINYIEKFDFKIECFGIPLAQLAYFFSNIKDKRIPFDCTESIILHASSTDLYVKKYIYQEHQERLEEIKNIEHIGKGIDPRKKAIVKKVVDTINSCIGALNSSELEKEYLIKEYKADVWLENLENQKDGFPICINESLSVMPNTIKSALLTKDDIYEYAAEARKDIFDAFREIYVKQNNTNLHSVILLGDLFRDRDLLNRFNNLVEDTDKIYVYENLKIYEILTLLPSLSDETLHYFKTYNENKIREVAKRVKEGKYKEENEKELDKKFTISRKYFEEAKKLFEKQMFFDAYVEINKALEEYKHDDYFILSKSLKEKIEIEKKITTLLAESKKLHEEKKFFDSLNILQQIFNLDRDNNDALKLYLFINTEIGDIFFKDYNYKKASENYLICQSFDPKFKSKYLMCQELVILFDKIRTTKIELKDLIIKRDFVNITKILEKYSNLCAEIERINPNDKRNREEYKIIENEIKSKINKPDENDNQNEDWEKLLKKGLILEAKKMFDTKNNIESNIPWKDLIFKERMIKSMINESKHIKDNKNKELAGTRLLELNDIQEIHKKFNIEDQRIIEIKSNLLFN